MKEATGELNMTVITVVAIAAVAAFFYAFVWPSIKSSITAGTKCANAMSCTCSGSYCDCTVYDPETGAEETVRCPNKDAASNNNG